MILTAENREGSLPENEVKVETPSYWGRAAKLFGGLLLATALTYTGVRIAENFDVAKEDTSNWTKPKDLQQQPVIEKAFIETKVESDTKDNGRNPDDTDLWVITPLVILGSLSYAIGSEEELRRREAEQATVNS